MILSCSKMDEYKKYVEGGELTYPAKLDSIRVLSGRYRATIQGVVAVNKGLSSFRVFWNNRRDSVVVPVQLTENVDTLSYTITNLPEGPMSFEVRSYDDKGNSSVPTFIVGNVYGERFRQSMVQRSMLASNFSAGYKANLSFQDVSKEMGVYGIRFKYTNRAYKQVDTVVQTPNIDASVSLPNFLLGKEVQYATVYKPDSVAIDTFMTPFVKMNLRGDVSDFLLKNFKMPFATATFDGNRWGTLADWYTNDAMKNHNGYGGFATDDGGTIHLEAGWGAPALENGKIYQKISMPAGRYAFSANVSWSTYSNNDAPAYLVFSKGDGIPDYDEVNSTTAVAFNKIGQNRFEFELTEETELNVGLVVKMYPDNLLRITYFKLELL